MKLVITQYAELELELIYDYLWLEASPTIAEGVLENIYQAIIQLTKFPHKAAIETYISSNYIYRRSVVGRYKIIYRIEGDTIYVTDVFDSRRDPLEMMP